MGADEDMARSLLLTLAIPTYKRADYLIPFLESVDLQLEQDKLQEVVAVHVSDNGSPDDTVERLRAFQESHPRMHLTFERQPANAGPDANTDKAVRGSRTPWTWLIGDDDVLLEGSLAYVVEKIRGLPPDISFMTVQHDVYSQDMKRLLVHVSSVLHGDRVFQGMDAQMAKLCSQHIFIGKHIFRTPRWAQTEKLEKYIGSRLLQLYFFLYWVGRGEKVAFFDRLCVLQRYNNSQMEPENVYEIFSGVLGVKGGMPQMVLDTLPDEKARRLMRAELFPPFGLLSYKKVESWGLLLPTKEDWELFHAAARNYGSLPKFWLYYPIQLFIPPALTRLFKNGYDLARSVRHRLS